MINGLQGIPGSGKSYEAVVFHILSALKRGRLVITNLPLNVEQFGAIDPDFVDLIQIRRKPSKILGSWDANRVDEEGNGNAFELVEQDEVIVGSAPTFGNVWDYYTTWRHPKGLGPLYVIDECHVPMPKLGTRPEVVEWFKLHRHFNCDVLLATQNFRDTDQAIAGLLAMLIKVRKADILGLKNQYIRKVHAGYRGAVIDDEIRDYKPQYFPLYKSHTQGMSIAETAADDVRPMILRFKRLNRMVLGIGLAGCIGVAYYAATKKPKTLTTVKVEQITQAAPTPARAASAPSPAALQPAVDPSAIPEPYETKSLHMTGRITMGDKVVYTFAVSQNGLLVANITDKELSRAGYKFRGTTDCTGVLTWVDKSRALSCDAPAVSMAMASPTKAAPQ